ncbi:FAD binding domain-containing protein [Athelia psychrophila]|uniref:FAD binding domain-containing protein n=1 Tax=Athelia psychrophila TaxID=1759441 RepID=A0A166LTK0_9AGAM|nr:FAD binding domain-containing protein [Fibularhizoctonia sp. CBS 109695]
MPRLLLAATALAAIARVACTSSGILSVTPSEWAGLSQQVGGRLYAGTPYSSPCFKDGLNSSACDSVRAGYGDELSRSNSSGAYINTQWETCQVTGAQCLLDSTDPSNEAPLQATQCQLGSVSNYYASLSVFPAGCSYLPYCVQIDVQRPEDVAAAFNFSRATGTHLVIKNTGHDYKGRSSAPNSLSLWTHHLKNLSYVPSFIPEGCSGASPAVTAGAGVQWGEAYALAEANNITVVGGSDKSVGTSGGWLQGGGHSTLSNTMGLGVDRVLQFKVVTPDGQYRTVNKCQNSDLFFALRGGGGSTFGVVLESTMLASPQVTLQAVIVSFSPNATLTQALWTIFVDNGVQWANAGWGGFANSDNAIYVNPKLTPSDAATSMAPLIQFGQKLVDAGVPGANVVITTFPSFGAFFDAVVVENVAAVGDNLAIASRLIPKANFDSTASRSTLVNALIATNTMTPNVIFLLGPPSSFPGDNTTSVTDAWRSSIYHITVAATWNWNATRDVKAAQYQLASKSIDHLRAITPDAAYQNEADVYEPNHEVSFWGDHYSRLLQIKKKYDPEQLLDCWHCVGFNANSSRFACYL